MERVFRFWRNVFLMKKWTLSFKFLWGIWNLIMEFFCSYSTCFLQGSFSKLNLHFICKGFESFQSCILLLKQLRQFMWGLHPWNASFIFIIVINFLWYFFNKAILNSACSTSYDFSFCLSLDCWVILINVTSGTKVYMH